MTQPNHPRHDPHPELSAPILDRDLEARIAAAEAAVMARDSRVRRRVHDISERVSIGKRRFVRKKLGVVAMVATGAGLAVAAFAWWRSRRSRRSLADWHSETPARRIDVPPPRKNRGSFLAFLPGLWRMLPAVVKNPVRKALSEEAHHWALLIKRFVQREWTRSSTVESSAATPGQPSYPRRS